MPKIVKTPLLVRLEVAKALADEERVLILDLLSRKPMCVQEIAEELEKLGYRKNLNTIRYHIQVLKNAGLIKLVGMREKRGGVLKYYASNAKVVSAEPEEDIRPLLEPLADIMKPHLKKLLLDVANSYSDKIIDIAKKLKPCPYCITAHFVEYVILEAINMALADIMEDKDFKHLASNIGNKK